MNREHYHIAVEECELGIVGHKVFVRLKDIPMYLSKRTKDSIRNRYSHSIEVGLSTEYVLAHISRTLGSDIAFCKRRMISRYSLGKSSSFTFKI